MSIINIPVKLGEKKIFEELMAEYFLTCYTKQKYMSLY